MMMLDELIDHREELNDLNIRSRVNATEAEALEVAVKMLDALIFQLKNQAVSFTP